MKHGTLKYYWQITVDILRNLFGLLHLHVLTLQEVRPEGENIKTFVFAQRKQSRHQAGQYGLWFLSRWVWGKPFRFFTVAASPTEQTLQFSTRVSDSDFKQKLASLPIGSKVYMFGPIGRFVLGKRPPRDAVLIAGGIGVTPLRAIAVQAHDAKLKTNLHVIHSSSGYYLYRPELERLVPDSQFVDKEEFVPALKATVLRVGHDTRYYVSGPPGFVDFAVQELRKLGVTRITKDGSLGY